MNKNCDVSELYRLMRRRKPATAMMIHAVCALGVLLAWAAIAPIGEAVSHRIKIVPANSIDRNAGALNLSSPIGGLIVDLDVAESSSVEEGDILLQFDSEELELRRNGELKKQAGLRKELQSRHRQSKLAQSSYVAKVSEFAAQKKTEEESHARLVAEQKIKMARAEAELQRARNEYQRGLKLQESRAISKSELESLRAAQIAAKGEVALAKLPISTSKINEIEQRINSLESSHAEDMHLIDAEKILLQTKLEAVENEVLLLNLKIEQCSIRAPQNGVVSQCQLRCGDWIPPGEIGISISQQGYVAEAILPSRLICDVRKGCKARIVLDGVDWLVHGSLSATVIEVGPDLRKEESVLGDGSAIVVDGYRVLLELEPNDGFKKWDSIRLGMTGSVEIDVGEKNLATYLLQKAIGASWLSEN